MTNLFSRSATVHPQPPAIFYLYCGFFFETRCGYRVRVATGRLRVLVEQLFRLIALLASEPLKHTVSGCVLSRMVEETVWLLENVIARVRTLGRGCSGHPSLLLALDSY